MFGANYFGQYWPEEAGITVETPFVPDPGGAEKRKRKKKKEENPQWPQPWESENYKPPTIGIPKIPVTVASPPSMSPPIAEAIPASPEAVQALTKNLMPALPMVDPAIARKAEALRLRMKRELEDEEILMMMGFFD